MKGHAPWDYKQFDKVKGQKPPYEDFGNFNYGATGLATGLFTQYDLLREAGRYQIASDTSNKDWGNPGLPNYPLTPLGVPPYGDDPKDAEQIKLGFAYYLAKLNGCV